MFTINKNDSSSVPLKDFGLILGEGARGAYRQYVTKPLRAKAAKRMSATRGHLIERAPLADNSVRGFLLPSTTVVRVI